MEIKEEGEIVVKGEQGGVANQRALGYLEFLTQDAYPSGTKLVYAHNRFIELSRLAMMWTVRHRWMARARFEFNFYMYWAQLLLCQPG